MVYLYEDDIISDLLTKKDFAMSRSTCPRFKCGVSSKYLFLSQSAGLSLFEGNYWQHEECQLSLMEKKRIMSRLRTTFSLWLIVHSYVYTYYKYLLLLAGHISLYYVCFIQNKNKIKG